MAEEPSPSYYLPIDGGRIFGFIPFPRVLVLCEMQSVSSRIWTRVAVSISCDDNHYNILIVIFIMIIIMLIAQILLTIFHHPSLLAPLLASLLDGIQIPHKADDWRFLLVGHGMSMCRSPLENVTYEFILIPPVVPSISCLSYLDGL